MRSKGGTVAMVGVLGVLAPVGGLVSACSAAVSNVGEVPFPDAGVTSDAGVVPPFDANATSDAAGSGDGAAGDGGVLPTDAGIEPGPTTILAVHASATLAPFRLCFGVGPDGDEILPLLPYPADPSQPMPGTNIPGVPVGGAALLPPITFGEELVTPYVVPAVDGRLESDESTSASPANCVQLICSNGGSSCLNQDYAQLPPVLIPLAGGTLLLAVGGCPANLAGVAETGAAGSPASCGASFADGGDAFGNMRATVAPLTAPSLDDGGNDSGGILMQVAQLSPSFNGGAGTDILYADPTTDASLSFTAPASPPFWTVALPPLSAAGALAAYVVIGPDSGAPMTQTLASIQYFQSPASDPTTYFNPSTVYFAAIVGDATGASAPASLADGGMNPAFDGHGLHVIAYPEPGN